MLETIKDFYDYFITFASLSLLLVALFYWIVLLIDKKQNKDFDTKYRETRNNNERKQNEKNKSKRYKRVNQKSSR